jgi:2-polyprenyl-6-methoxyphenol hydroxylase-like FAD-dependent oxidoreductase
MSRRSARYPWGALWFVGRDARERRDATVLHQVCDGNRTLLGMLPTGLGPARHPKGAVEPELLSLFWSVRADSMDAWRARGLGPWKDEVRILAPESAPILDQVEHIDQILFAAYHDVVMHRLATRNVVYLGDAAHATSPQLGQGANLALWDAMVLADCVESEPSDLARALDRYSRQRADHLAFYQVATRWLTPFFQGDVGILGDMRDVFMPLMSRLSSTNRIMTLSMLGVFEGFYGRTLSLCLPRESASGKDSA